jgi:Tfp pilus assembly protein PilN
MHTIDLLRGQGIPAKTTFGSVAMVIVMVVVPILAAAGMVDRYMQNKTDIEIQQQTITTEEATIDKFADAVKFKESLEKDQGAINSKLSEVSSCLGNYIQWSPVLKTLAEHMPAKMVMSGLRAESTSVRQQVTSEKGPKRTVNVNVSRRMLVLDISGSELRDYGSEVENYSKRLKSSPVLGPKLEGIEFSQKPGSAGDLNTVSYTMNLMFKSGTL